MSYNKEDVKPVFDPNLSEDYELISSTSYNKLEEAKRAAEEEMEKYKNTIKRLGDEIRENNDISHDPLGFSIVYFGIEYKKCEEKFRELEEKIKSAKSGDAILIIYRRTPYVKEPSNRDIDFNRNYFVVMDDINERNEKYEKEMATRKDYESTFWLEFSRIKDPEKDILYKVENVGKIILPTNGYANFHIGAFGLGWPDIYINHSFGFNKEPITISSAWIKSINEPILEGSEMFKYEILIGEEAEQRLEKEFGTGIADPLIKVYEKEITEIKDE